MYDTPDTPILTNRTAIIAILFIIVAMIVLAVPYHVIVKASLQKLNHTICPFIFNLSYS